MCDTCGCEDTNNINIAFPGKENEHSHKHHHHHDDHSHDHHHHHDHKKIDVEIDIMSKNNLMAERNRGYFEAKDIMVYNMVSSPGSGKTTLLEKSIMLLKERKTVLVIEGDQQTANDAARIEATGVKAIQINTGNGCHLDADMINRAVKMLEVPNDSVLFIENVGNLVCPALFDLGEEKRIVLMSVTEGEDKPLKYPNMFQTSDICLITKTDLAPYVDFDLKKAKENALKVNHHLKFFELSSKTGEGMQEFVDYLIGK